MEGREIAQQFVARFAAGDIDSLEPLLHPDFQFRGPYLEVDSRKEYLDALRADPPGRHRARLLDVREHRGRIEVRWEYLKPETVSIRQWFRVSGGVITQTHLEFPC